MPSIDVATVKIETADELGRQQRLAYDGAIAEERRYAGGATALGDAVTKMQQLHVMVDKAVADGRMKRSALRSDEALGQLVKDYLVKAQMLLGQLAGMQKQQAVGAAGAAAGIQRCMAGVKAMQQEELGKLERIKAEIEAVRAGTRTAPPGAPVDRRIPHAKKVAKKATGKKRGKKKGR